jgi:hypothetical protein
MVPMMIDRLADGPPGPRVRQDLLTEIFLGHFVLNPMTPLGVNLFGQLLFSDPILIETIIDLFHQNRGLNNSGQSRTPPSVNAWVPQDTLESMQSSFQKMVAAVGKVDYSSPGKDWHTRVLKNDSGWQYQIDLRGTSGYGRLTYPLGTDKFTPAFSPLTAFEPDDSYNSGIVLPERLGMTTLNTYVGEAVLDDGQRIYFLALVAKKFGDQGLFSQLILRKTLSMRAGALLGQLGLPLNATLPPAGGASSVSMTRKTDPSHSLGELSEVAMADSMSSAVSVGVVPADMDFNSMLVDGSTTLMPDFLAQTYVTAKSFDRVLPSDVFGALKVLSNNSTSSERMVLQNYIDKTVNRGFSTTLIRDQVQAARSVRIRKFANITPEKVASLMSDQTASKKIVDLQGRKEEIAQLLSTITSPVDYISSFQDQRYPDCTLRLMNPVILAGSLHAQTYVSALEAAVRQATARRPTDASQYITSLVAHGEEFHASVANKALMSLKTTDPMSLIWAQYALGFSNIRFYTGLASYRLGQTAGEVQGALEAYTTLQLQLRGIVDIPPIPDNATLDDVLRAIEQIALNVKATIDSLHETIAAAQALIKDLQDKVDSLNAQLQATLRAWHTAGIAVSVLAFAGAGALIGGPIGAGVGAVVGLVAGLVGL